METKTRAEIEGLKRQWLNDPAGWALEYTQGFGAHHEELAVFRQENKALVEWKEKKLERDARWARVEVAAVAFVANGHFDAERAIAAAQELIGALDAARAAEEETRGRTCPLCRRAMDREGNLCSSCAMEEL